MCRRPAAHARGLAAVPARLTTHDVNIRGINFTRYREECLREGIDPHTAVKVEALRFGLLGQRLDDAIESLVDDVRQWNIEARTEEVERELLRSLQGAVQKVVQRTADKLPAADDENQQDPCTTRVAFDKVLATAPELRKFQPHSPGAPEKVW
ncbi:hypothetical protein [Streptomyces sp. NPDC006510]|uniref:hypothetical protein n=1 Tax=Streptomyces sp. NPDC006510 TaxID=3155600 RepID=UPI0033BE0A93